MAAAAVKGLSEENKDGQKGSSVGNVEASENKAGHSGPMSGTSKETCVSVLAQLANAEDEIMLVRVGYTTSYNPQTKLWVKRDTNTGRFMDNKQDGTPFKGVRKEK